MMAATIQDPDRAGLSAIRTALKQWNKPLTLAGLGFAALALVCLAMLLIDPRMLGGAPLWMKPLKFAVSLAIFCLSWAWLMEYVPPRFAAAAKGLAIALVFLSVLEFGYIAAQAARGVTSHFNYATDLDATMFMVAGVAVLLLWLCSAALTATIWGLGGADRALKLSIRLGMLISLAGMAIGTMMTGPSAAQEAAQDAGADLAVIGAHSVGVADGGPGIPVLGWSTEGGDLRIGHFIGIHALQLLPLLAALLSRGVRRYAWLSSEQVRVRLIWVASSGYAAMTALLTWQATRGQALLDPDGVTLGMLAAVVSSIAIGSRWAVVASGDQRTDTLFEVSRDAPTS